MSSESLAAEVEKLQGLQSESGQSLIALVESLESSVDTDIMRRDGHMDIHLASVKALAKLAQTQTQIVKTLALAIAKT